MSTPPEAIGDFRVLDSLGRGDFAVVYRVGKGDSEYALKLAHADSTEARVRLRIEAEALKALDHPSIPKFEMAGVFENRPYVVMKLAKGRSLRQDLQEKQTRGAVYGDIEALDFLVHLLDALSHLHGAGLVHRDIKDANIMVASEPISLTLIDFGFSKIINRDDIRLGDSFFRAGAIRYSPPLKIQRPEVAVPNHDVFAAGVIAYQMLTGTHPWSVNADQGLGAYRDAQRRPPIPLTEINPRVDRSISQFVMSLLEHDDARRPQANEARSQAQTLLRAASKRALSGRRSPVTPLQFARVTRDNIYGDIRLTDFEWQVLNTPEVQRLRWIKQLGLTNLVYLGAEHTRLAHSIGCVHRVEQILRSIEDIEGVRIERETRLVARLFALVHDVSHIPYSHTVEDELGIFTRHDSNHARVQRLILREPSQLFQVLSDNEIGRAVLSHFDPDATIQRRSSVLDLVSSSTGADVLDYIDRDAFHCGLDHRIDSAILRQFRLERLHATPGDSRLVSLLYGTHGVRLDREFAVQSLLNERYALFLKVYTHRSKISASALLGKGLVELTHPKDGTEGLNEADYEWMSDFAVLERLAHSESNVAKDAAARLMQRRLPRATYRAPLLSSDDQQLDMYEARRTHMQSSGVFSVDGRRQVEAELAGVAGLSPHEVIVYCPQRAPGYQMVEHHISSTPGNTSAVDHVKKPYHTLRGKHLGLWEIWVFSVGDPSRDSVLTHAAYERFGFENRLTDDRRQERSA